MEAMGSEGSQAGTQPRSDVPRGSVERPPRDELT
jgi:hypothetical protein